MSGWDSLLTGVAKPELSPDEGSRTNDRNIDVRNSFPLCYSNFTRLLFKPGESSTGSVQSSSMVRRLTRRCSHTLLRSMRPAARSLAPCVFPLHRGVGPSPLRSFVGPSINRTDFLSRQNIARSRRHRSATTGYLPDLVYVTSIRCRFVMPNLSRPTRRDATKQCCDVGSGGVNWALRRIVCMA